MFLVITYDVATHDKAGRRRLAKIARACEDYGLRVQKSVFEFKLDRKTCAELRNRLLRILKLEQDSLRIYVLDEVDQERIEHYGIGEPLDLEAPLIL